MTYIAQVIQKIILGVFSSIEFYFFKVLRSFLFFTGMQSTKASSGTIFSCSGTLSVSMHDLHSI